MRDCIKRGICWGIVSVFIITAILPLFVMRIYGQEKRTVRVAMWERGGRFESDGSGSYRGYDADLLNKISDFSGIEFELVQVEGPGQAVEALDQGRVDLITSMRQTEERKEKYIYSGLSTGSTFSGLIALKERDDLKFKDLEAFRKCRIGYEGNSGSKDIVLKYLLETCGATELEPFDTIAELSQALHDGRIDLMATGANNVGEDEKILSRFGPEEVYYLSSRKNAELIDEMDNAMANLEVNFPTYLNTLQTTYFPMYITTEITKEEEDYIAEREAVRIGVPEGRCPISYRDEETGELTGIMIDMLNLVADRTGLTFEYVPMNADMDAEEAFDQGTYELIAPTVDKDHYTGSQDSYISNRLMEGSATTAALTRALDTPKKSYTIGVAKEIAGLKAYVEEKYPQYKVVLYDNQEQVLQALKDNEIDTLINSTYVWTYLFQSPMYKDIAVIPSISVTFQYCIAGRKSGTDATLFDIINKGIASISSSETDSIILQYTGKPLYHYTFMDYLYVYRNVIAVTLGFCLLFLTGAMVIVRIREQNFKKLEVTNDLLLKANQAKLEFLSRMSHDIRTPMNAIVGISRMGVEESKEPASREYFEKIRSSSDYLLSLLNDVLDMSIIESGQIELHEVAISADEFAKIIIDMQETNLKSKRITLRFEKKVSTPYVYCDPVRLQQVYMNILNNAVKFSDEGSIIDWKMIETRIEGDIAYYEVMFRDYGCGMSKEFMERIFQPFEQEKTRDNDQKTGTGLGLAISKNLIEQMGGTISVKSELGVGTEFTIHISHRIGKKENVNLERQKKEELAEEQIEELRGLNILLCEDNNLNAQIATKILEKKGMVVTLAENGKKGVDIFSNSRIGSYDAVLMDIRMPIMDGIEAAKAIRSLKRLDAQCIPMIALTANAYEEDKRKCWEAGMNEHLTKPIEPAKIYETLYYQIKKVQNNGSCETDKVDIER